MNADRSVSGETLSRLDRWVESDAYQRWLRRLGVVLGGLLVIVLIAWPRITNFYSWNDQYYNAIVASAAISAILTISLNLCMGFGGLLSIMHTGLQLLGGYGVATLFVRFGVDPLIGLVLAVVLGAVVSALTITVSLRSNYLYFGMITLAANLVIVEVGKVATPLTNGSMGLSGVVPQFGGHVMDKTTFYYVILALLAVCYVVQRNLVRSGLGRASMAIREAPETAAALGISPTGVKVQLFAISGGIAGLAGGLYALQLGFINPNVGLLENGLIFFVGLFLGGIGTLLGPLLGVGVIALISEAIKDYARWTTLIMGLILLACMLIVPRGVVGTWRVSRFGRVPRRVIEEEQPGDLPESVAVSAPEGGRSDSGGSGPAVLVARGLHKRFGGVQATDNVDIAVESGVVHGIIGPNGSGKSTLVSLLTSFVASDSGTVEIAGTPASTRPHLVARAGVTRVFQVPHLFDEVSVLDNVLTGMRTRERYTWLGAVFRSPAYRRQDRTERAEALDLLAFAGLAGRADWTAGALSHGQKRLLEVVRALATRPKVLILDEPATGLTSVELEALAHLCRSLAEHGVAVLLIEHNMEFVMTVCDTITVIASGSVIASGDPETVRSSPVVLEAYLGRPELLAEEDR